MDFVINTIAKLDAFGRLHDERGRFVAENIQAAAQVNDAWAAGMAKIDAAAAQSAKKASDSWSRGIAQINDQFRQMQAMEARLASRPPTAPVGGPGISDPASAAVAGQRLSQADMAQVAADKASTEAFVANERQRVAMIDEEIAAIKTLGATAKGQSAEGLAEIKASIEAQAAYLQEIGATEKQLAEIGALQAKVASIVAKPVKIPLNDEIDKIPYGARRAGTSLASLIFISDGMFTSARGAAASVSMLAFQVSNMSNNARVAASAAGIAGLLAVVVALGEAMAHTHDKAIEVDDAFKEHLKAENLRSLNADIEDLNKKVGYLSDHIPTLGERLHHMWFEASQDEIAALGPFQTFLYSIGLFSAETDAAAKTQNELNEAHLRQKDLLVERISSQRELTRTTNDYLQRQLQQTGVTEQQLILQKSGHQLSADLTGIYGEQEAKLDAINKQFRLTYDQQGKLIGFSKQELELRDQLVAREHNIAQLRVEEAERQNALRIKEFNEGQRALISGATSDIDNTSQLARDEERLKKQHDIDIEAARKTSADRALVDEAYLAQRERAWRDSAARIQRQEFEVSQQRLAAQGEGSFGDPLAKYKAEADAIDDLQQHAAAYHMTQEQADALASDKRKALRRKENDDVVASLTQQFSAYQNYSGLIGKTAKLASDALRLYQIGAQVAYDYQMMRSEWAKAAAAAASGNFAGAALHGVAAGLFAAAGAFGAAEAFGGGGGGGGGGSGGAGSANSTTVQRDDANQAGAQVINLYTVDPFSKAVISATSYALERAGVLKRPMIPPTVGLATG